LSTQCELINQKYLWLEVLRFNGQGLIPAIVQDFQDASILMLTEIDKKSLREIIDAGHIRHTYIVRAVFYDCDADALLIKAEQNHGKKDKSNWIAHD
jgi:phosphoribosyl-AMP cyclohydrolase